MDQIQHFLHSLHGRELENLIQSGGFLLLFAIVFAETGLLVGFFLPGDSLLFTAGALVGIGVLKAPAPLPQDPFSSILLLNLVLIAAAITGDTVGYWFGRKTGTKLYSRPDSKIFKKEHLIKTQAFYERYGGKTIILARWVPFARTFAPIIAGVAGMDYRTFMTYNVVGGISWVVGCTLLGFFLGRIPLVRAHNEKAILLIIFLSLLPAIYHALKERAEQKKAHAETHVEASALNGGHRGSPPAGTEEEPEERTAVESHTDRS
jgi:membrane-associated protein